MDEDKYLGDTARIVVLGDPGVGKSSLIAAATESFDPNPPPCLPPTRLPPQIENVPLLVVDTSTRSENRQSLESLVEGADVVVLCYSVDMPDSVRNLRVKWLPDLRKLNCNLPVVLCGCRMDLEPDQYALDLQRGQLEELLKEYREIETAIECSAQTLSMVQETFHFALKAVVHPQFPLYDTINQRLRPRCTQALRRVFLLCDVDKDNKLNEAEINAFQVKCFNSPLQPDELGGVLNTVYQKLPQGVVDNGLSLSGFLFLHALFMERGGFETTWAVLRTYGYTNELTLTDELLKGINFEPTGDQVVCQQLSDKAIAFLTEWFQKLDEDRSLAIKEAAILAEMDETAPERLWAGPEWKYVLVANAHPGRITLEGFLGKWKYSMLKYPRDTLKQIMYLGWNGGMVSDLCNITRRKRTDKRDASSRYIIQCMVFGSKGCGKTSLLRALIGQATSLPDEGEEMKGDHTAVASVALPPTTEKTLVMREMGVEAVSNLPNEPENASIFDEADVAAFLFDSSDPKSFHDVQKLMLQVSAVADTLPCVFIATKRDLPMPKELSEDISKVCDELKMRQPIQISTLNGELNKVFRTLTQIAMKPGMNDIPETPARKAARARRKWMHRMLALGIVGTVTGVAALYMWPSSKKDKRNHRNST